MKPWSEQTCKQSLIKGLGWRTSSYQQNIDLFPEYVNFNNVLLIRVGVIWLNMKAHEAKPAQIAGTILLLAAVFLA